MAKISRGLSRRDMLRTLALLSASLGSVAARATTPWGEAQQVPRKRLEAALRTQQQQGYRLDAIANAVRLQAAWMLALATQAGAEDPLQRPLRVDHRDHYAAFVEVADLAPDKIPSFVNAPYQAKEDLLFDFRMDRVLDLAATRDRPRRALNVKAGWPEESGAAASYSYEDRSTDPHIETTRQQVTSWRILDYGDVIVYDQLQGVGGRATSGLLGAVFEVVGHAQARQTRFAIAADGTQVSLTTARKGLSFTLTVVITPDGRVTQGLPAGRPDLERVEQRLRTLPMDVVYRPLDRSPVQRRVSG
ncbi:MAG: hypothetical protein JNJ89_04560 [Rubrivivax sp.]|nr:hypothetical protein [Rubrivivax sp.]